MKSLREEIRTAEYERAAAAEREPREVEADTDEIAREAEVAREMAIREAASAPVRILSSTIRRGSDGARCRQWR